MKSNLSVLTSRRSLGCFLAVAALLATASGCGDTSVAEEASAAADAPKQNGAAPAASAVELGEFSLSQVRPLENSTLIIRFQAHAAAAPENAERLSAELTRHHHQAREQVIVAVRTAETGEFDEPDLLKLRRRIVLRLNRWLDAPLVEDVFLTEFRFRAD